MGRKQVFSDAENERLRAEARRLIERVGSQNYAAEILGIASSSMSMFLAGKTGASLALAQAIARESGMELPAVTLPTEGHRWKIGPDTWAVLTITGPYDASELERLRQYVALIVPDETTATDARSA